ncbi:MAG: DUF805 domain-containing protein [Azospirillum sp.]|nr:DUF805 domain-containing protein [Azospirillum sp.]
MFDFLRLAWRALANSRTTAGRSSRWEYAALCAVAFVAIVGFPYGALLLVAPSDLLFAFSLSWAAAVTVNTPMLVFFFFVGGMGLGSPSAPGIAAIGIYAISIPFVFAGLSVQAIVRRLHDVGRSGWWALILIPPQVLAAYLFLVRSGVPLWTIGVVGSLGWVWLLWFLVRPGDAGPNRFGPGPRADLNARCGPSPDNPAG